MAKLPCLAIASSVTNYGRDMIMATREYIERTRPGSEVLYGDSVAAGTPIVVADVDLQVRVVPIQDLADEWVPFADKEEGIVKQEYARVWSDGGFVSLQRVIRHRLQPQKRMYRIATALGFVDVTSDHSLLRDDGSVVRPEECAIGTRLLHGSPEFMHLPAVVEIAPGTPRMVAQSETPLPEVPPFALNATLESKLRYWQEVFVDGGRLLVGDCVRCETALEAQSVLWFMHAVGYGYVTVALEPDAGAEGACVLHGHPRAYPVAHMDSAFDHGFHRSILSIRDVTDLHQSADPFVYDLETLDHHFAAGAGRIVVHNTDSVMVRFTDDLVPDMETAIAFGKDIAAEITEALFVPPINLAFEKIFYPFLLMMKKKYIALHWTKAAEPDFINYKGVEVARRDNCLLVVEVMKGVVEAVMKEQDVDKAVAIAKGAVTDLLMCRVPIEKLVVSKKLSRAARDYAGKQAHVECAERMRRRDPQTAPVLGDRVAYVIVSGAGSSMSDRAEDPAYVTEQGIPIDAQYYIGKQLRGPVERVMEPIIGPAATRSIFEGDHTRKVVRRLPKSGGLLNFFSVLEKPAEGTVVPPPTPETAKRDSPEPESQPAPAPKRRRRAPGGGQRTLHSFFGPAGGQAK